MVCVTQLSHRDSPGQDRQHQGLCRAGRGSGGSQELLLPPESSGWAGAESRGELVFSGTFRGNEVTTWSLFENKILFASQKSLGKCLQHPCPLLPAPLSHSCSLPSAHCPIPWPCPIPCSAQLLAGPFLAPGAALGMLPMLWERRPAAVVLPG